MTAKVPLNVKHISAETKTRLNEVKHSNTGKSLLARKPVETLTALLERLLMPGLNAEERRIRRRAERG